MVRGRAFNRLLAGRVQSRRVPDDFESIAALLAEAATPSPIFGDTALRLKAWWIYRMLFSPDPLGERLTLMWHNHFVTSNLKVDDPRAMHRQNEIFRKLARRLSASCSPR